MQIHLALMALGLAAFVASSAHANPASIAKRRNALQQRLSFYFTFPGRVPKKGSKLRRPIKEIEGLGLIVGASSGVLAYVVDNCDVTAGEPCDFTLMVHHLNNGRLEQRLSWSEAAPPKSPKVAAALARLLRLKIDPSATLSFEKTTVTHAWEGGFGPPSVVGPLGSGRDATFARDACLKQPSKPGQGPRGVVEVAAPSLASATERSCWGDEAAYSQDLNKRSQGICDNSYRWGDGP